MDNEQAPTFTMANLKSYFRKIFNKYHRRDLIPHIILIKVAVQQVRNRQESGHDFWHRFFTSPPFNIPTVEGNARFLADCILSGRNLDDNFLGIVSPPSTRNQYEHNRLDHI